MRELRFVGPGEDGDHLVVETVVDGEQFSLAVDDGLREATRPDLPKQSAAEAQHEPSITPREIQVRVRAGEAPESVATEAEMPVERVLVFAGPVLDERARVAEEARRARARRSTTEGQLVGFGAAVDARFAAHGIEPGDVRWDARRREDGQWVVSASWRGGDADRSADWAFSLSARTLTPMDQTAADLLSDRPIRPVVRAVPDPPDAEAATAPLPVTVDDGDVEPNATAPESVRGPVDAPALPLPIPSMPPRPSTPEPALPLHPQHSETRKPPRPRVPGWDDILLGVRRKRD